MKKIIVLLICIISFFESHAQRITSEQYIDMYKDLAIREMKRMGIPAAITLAQGLLESEGGNSELLKKSNNHFGIKCKDTWSATGVSHDDDARGECFRVYKNAEESYRDHSNFLRSRSWYAPLFKLDPKDYKGWAYGLKKAGYATNPHYPEMLIKFIEDHKLQQYDDIPNDQIAHFDPSKYTDDPEDNAAEDSQGGGVETLSKSAAGRNQSGGEEITVNSTKAFPIKSGTSLLAFAIDHHLNLDKLLEYNDLKKDGLADKDQYLFVSRKSRDGATEFYTVQENETLWEISQKNGIRLQKLIEYNQLKDDERIPAGTVLHLNATRQTGRVMSNPEQKTHIVEAREGLNSISKKYGITVSQIKAWNGLHDDHLRVGQELIISN